MKVRDTGNGDTLQEFKLDVREKASKMRACISQLTTATAEDAIIQLYGISIVRAWLQCCLQEERRTFKLHNWSYFTESECLDMMIVKFGGSIKAVTDLRIEDPLDPLQYEHVKEMRQVLTATTHRHYEARGAGDEPVEKGQETQVVERRHLGPLELAQEGYRGRRSRYHLAPDRAKHAQLVSPPSPAR